MDAQQQAGGAAAAAAGLQPDQTTIRIVYDADECGAGSAAVNETHTLTASDASLSSLVVPLCFTSSLNNGIFVEGADSESTKLFIQPVWQARFETHLPDVYGHASATYSKYNVSYQNITNGVLGDGDAPLQLFYARQTEAAQQTMMSNARNLKATFFPGQYEIPFQPGYDMSLSVNRMEKAYTQSNKLYRFDGTTLQTGFYFTFDRVVTQFFWTSVQFMTENADYKVAEARGECARDYRDPATNQTVGPVAACHQYGGRLAIAQVFFEWEEKMNPPSGMDQFLWVLSQVGGFAGVIYSVFKAIKLTGLYGMKSCCTHWTQPSEYEQKMHDLRTGAHLKALINDHHDRIASTGNTYDGDDVAQLDVSVPNSPGEETRAPAKPSAVVPAASGEEEMGTV